MAAVFPISVDPTAQQIPFNIGLNSSCGVYVKDSTTRYTIGKALNNDVGDVLITVYKSTNQGQDGSWNLMDADNAPSAGGGQAASACLNGAVIRVVVFNENTSSVALYEFNTATDTWGALIASATTPPNSSSNGANFCAQLGSTLYAVGQWNDVPGSSPAVAGTGLLTFASGSWSGYTAFDAPPFTFQTGMAANALIVTTTRVHCILSCGGSDGVEDLDALFQSNITTSGTAITKIGGTEGFFGELVGSIPCVGCSNGPGVFMAFTGLGSSITDELFKIAYSTAVDADTLAFTEFSIIDPTGEVDGVEVQQIGCTFINPSFILFYDVEDDNTDPVTSTFFFAVGPVSTEIGVINQSAGTGFVSASPTGLTFPYAISFSGGSLDYWEEASVAPPVVTATITKAVGGGASYFPRVLNKSLLLAQIARVYATPLGLRDFPPLSSFFLFPNDFDLCLSRELALYGTIDRLAMSCARKPECFLQSERDWLDSPPGWRTFNPVKAIALPDPAAGDVTVLAFRVPYGYDGVITAQYHGYTAGFTEGSGDIVWRVSADGRYLRGMGDMELTIGNPKQLSPVYGGLQLRSGNLVKYTVSAPNVTGLLPPGGNVLAGLHGFFYPRM